MKISAVIIGKNEEVMLPQCLESLKGIDEIIYCDTGSSDSSIEVAKRYTDKVFNDYTWSDNFAEARNHAKAKATGDWILSIDCDENLESFEAVRETAQKAENIGALAVDCLLHTVYGNKSDWYFPRLFKNSPRVAWAGEVHNHLTVPADRIGNVKINVDYSPAHKLDPERSYRILKKAVAKDPHGRNLYYLGREHWYRGEYDRAVTILGKYVQESKFAAEKADAFLTMAMCYWHMRMSEDAKDACLQAIKIDPHFKEAILYMANLYGHDRGNPEWQRNADQWMRMAEKADSRDVLFNRT